MRDTIAALEEQVVCDEKDSSTKNGDYGRIGQVRSLKSALSDTRGRLAEARDESERARQRADVRFIELSL